MGVQQVAVNTAFSFPAGAVALGKSGERSEDFAELLRQDDVATALATRDRQRMIERERIADVRAMRGRLDSKYAAFNYPWVRILDPVAATAAATRVMIEFKDAESDRQWTTVSVDRNIISASLNALVDGFEYALKDVVASCLLDEFS